MLRKHVISKPCRRAKQTCCVSSRQFSQGSSHASYLDVGLRDFVTHPFRPSTHPFMHPLCMPIIVEVASLTLSASCIWSLQSQRFRNRLKLQSQRFRSQKEVCRRIPVLSEIGIVRDFTGACNLLRPHYLLWCGPCDMRPLSASTFIGLLHARRCQFTRGWSVCRGSSQHDEHFRNICILTQTT